MAKAHTVMSGLLVNACSEEPDALIALVRVCGGAPRVTGGSTRKRRENGRWTDYLQGAELSDHWCLFRGVQGEGQRLPGDRVPRMPGARTRALRQPGLFACSAFFVVSMD